jgi:hypothetical protein
MRTPLRYKRPGERLDYDVDFGRRWLIEGDSIQSAAVSVTGGSVASDAYDIVEGKVVKVWLVGGAEGETAHVTVMANTVQGREKEACFRVRIRSDC